MVMDAQPSPQCVGREFVRQYYTLLNNKPAHLHRFYNSNSLFVHGGLESMPQETDPVVGQKKIHERIQQLNFRDCHAKISQVDSQATLGNGVVVQVSGELSNAGEPMRRFTQTFVLATQAPKKYYVHNDIFRYQDVYGDDEIEAESGRTDEDDPQVVQERTGSGEMSPPQSQNIQGGYYGGVGVNTGVAVNGSTHHEEVQVAPSAPQAPQGMPQIMTPLYQTTVDHFHHMQQPPQQPPPQQQPLPQLHTTPQPPPQLQQQQQQVIGVKVEQPVTQNQTGITPVPQDVYQQNEQEEEEDEEEDEEEPEEEVFVPAEEGIEDDGENKQNLDSNYQSLEQESEISHDTAPASNEPPTYATRLKSGTGACTGGSTMSNLNVSPQGPAKSPSSPPPGLRVDSRNDVSLSGGRGQVTGSRGGPRGGATVRGMSRGNERPGVQRPIPTDGGNNFGDTEKRRIGGPQQLPDNQQLFLGNIPLTATENDLRELFGKYGSIVDLRIMNKTNTKGQLPNFGFIVFEDVATVQAVLQNRPFYFPPENGTKLNVEEKKTRARGSTDGRITSGGDMRGGGGGGPRMGPGGPSLRGGNRGGFSQGRGIFTHGRGGAPPMRPGGPGFNQRNSVPR